MIYDVSGTRNWVILKGALSGRLLLRCLAVACVSSGASIPPTISFFSEVIILREGGFVRMLFALMMRLYLFVGGLVPLFLVGCLLSRHYSIRFGCGYVSSYITGV